MSWWRRWIRRDPGQARVQDLAEQTRPLSPQERGWLERERGRDPELGRTYDALARWHRLRRQAPRVSAPAEFADRVVQRARAERDATWALPSGARRSHPWRWGALGAAGAALVTVFVLGIQLRPGTEGVAISGLGRTEVQADLVVRLPDVGAVEARRVFESAVGQFGGTSERLESVVLARVPRTQLLAVLEALAEQGTVDVERGAEAVTDEAAVVVVKLELGR